MDIVTETKGRDKMANNELKNLCGVWLSDKVEGKDRYMSGTMRKEDVAEILSCSNESPDGKVRVMIFKNNKRPEKRDPDYRIVCCVPNPPKTQQESKPAVDYDKDASPF